MRRGEGRQVLIVSHLWEPSVDAVIREMDKLGTRWARLNCEDFPAMCSGTTTISPARRAMAELRLPESVLRSDEFSTVWFRRVAKPPLPRGLSPRDREFVQGEAAAFLSGFLNLIQGRWVNDRAAQDRASSKIVQLEVAREVGMQCPNTLITNVPSAVRDFANTVGTDVIFKPVSGFSPRGADFTREFASLRADGLPYYELEVPDPPDKEPEMLFSQMLTEERMAELEALQFCPATFQEYVPKRVEIRVTVVGQDALFACEIESQEHGQTKVDFRKMILMDDPDQLSHRRHDLPVEVSEQIFRFMASLGLQFGCIDLILTPDDKYVFLEVNPSGQWMWIESRLDWPISASVASLLSRAG